MPLDQWFLTFFCSRTPKVFNDILIEKLQNSLKPGPSPNWQEAKTMKPLFVGKNAVKVASCIYVCCIYVVN
jgi:hypothetical protein